MHISLRLLRSEILQHPPLAQVHGALLTIMRVKAAHAHVAACIDAGGVGEDVVYSGLQPGCMQNPVYEDTVGIGDYDAVDVFLILRYEGQELGHAVGERDALHDRAHVLRRHRLLSDVGQDSTHILGPEAFLV